MERAASVGSFVHFRNWHLAEILADICAKQVERVSRSYQNNFATGRSGALLLRRKFLTRRQKQS
jgi:hypothetical protein